jgi:hypothetical protein
MAQVSPFVHLENDGQSNTLDGHQDLAPSGKLWKVKKVQADSHRHLARPCKDQTTMRSLE